MTSACRPHHPALPAPSKSAGTGFASSLLSHAWAAICHAPSDLTSSSISIVRFVSEPFSICSQATVATAMLPNTRISLPEHRLVEAAQVGRRKRAHAPDERGNGQRLRRPRRRVEVSVGMKVRGECIEVRRRVVVPAQAAELALDQCFDRGLVVVRRHGPAPWIGDASQERYRKFDGGRKGLARQPYVCKTGAPSPVRLLNLRRLVLLDVGEVALLLDVLVALSQSFANLHAIEQRAATNARASQRSANRIFGMIVFTIG